MKKSIPFLNLGPLLENESTQCLTWQDDIFFINSYELPEMCHEPFQTDFSLIFLMKKGKITGELNCRRLEAIAPCLFIIPSHMLQKVIDISKITEKKLLILSKNVTDGIFTDRKKRFFLNQAFLSNPIISLSEKQYQNHLLYFNLIENELQESGHLNPSKTIQKLFEALLSKYPANETVQKYRKKHYIPSRERIDS